MFGKFAVLLQVYPCVTIYFIKYKIYCTLDNTLLMTQLHCIYSSVKGNCITLIL